MSLSHPEAQDRRRAIQRINVECGPRSQPLTLAECHKIDAGRRIPAACRVSGAELECNLLVSVRNSQWRARLRTRSGVAGLCHPFCGACRFPRPRCFCFRFLPLRRGGALTGR